ncbi:MAG: hypothetical protein MUC49_08490 [Raineya sp.]|jgi:antitoxin component YwqK of YwqJK toxin-antitoxin module|nr:hypothetical protein [Raineya sp.]
MKYIFFLIFFLYFNKGLGQSYKIIFYNQCTKIYSDFPECFYTLKDHRDCTYYVNTHNEGKESFIKLPNTGKYRLHSDCLDDDDFFKFEVNIKNNALKIDTFNIVCLKLLRQISNPPISHYYCCDTVCNGRFTDYYHNGKIRKTGVFKKGQAIDTVKEYYSSGGLKRLFIPLQKWWKKYDYVRKRPDYIWMDYHEKGYLMRLLNTRKNNEIIYHPNQKIKSNYQYEKKQKYIEYDTNGIKRAIILFNQKEEYSWEEAIDIKKVFFADGSLQYVFKKTESWGLNNYFYQEYNKKGDLVRVTEFCGEYWKYGASPNHYPESIEAIPTEYMKEDILYISSTERIKKTYTVDVLEKGKRILQKVRTENMRLTNGTWITEQSKTEYYNQKP